MKRNVDTKEITFKNDAEFYDFAVVQADKFERSESGILVLTWDFTYNYLKAVEEGYKFIITDKNSQVVKHQAACYRTVCKPVEVYAPEYSGIKH